SLHPLLFSILSLHPTPTLFPYTTLFRSVPLTRPRALAIGPASRAGSHPAPRLAVGLDPGRRSPRLFLPSRGPLHRRSRPPGARADRKSTRLNSSHLVISYAVFCLKKKN